MRRIGTFEAKTHFSALVDAAERGETIIVTRKGKPVAQLGPVQTEGARALTADEAAGRILARSLRLGIPVRELIEEGRRY